MADIRTIAEQFANRTLPKAAWTHGAHIAVAFVELDAHGNFDGALASLRQKIRAYNESVGTENTDESGYHETLTVLWLRIVDTYCRTMGGADLEADYQRFLKTLPAMSQFPALLYSRKLLFSKQARHSWVAPDLLPIEEIETILHHGMEPHHILTDEAFEAQFADATLDPALFTHEAHLRLAWIHIRKYGEAVAIDNITQQLIRYVGQLGAADKYDAALTVAAIRAVGLFMDKREIGHFHDFIAAYPVLKSDFSAVLASHLTE